MNPDYRNVFFAALRTGSLVESVRKAGCDLLAVRPTRCANRDHPAWTKPHDSRMRVLP